MSIRYMNSHFHRANNTTRCLAQKVTELIFPDLLKYRRMANESLISFKVYLQPQDAEPEIRRFAVRKDFASSFVFLKQKLISVFPSLDETPFIISWKDHEGDPVQIWSDEELLIALTEMPDERKKLYIIPTQGGDLQTSQGANKPQHFGVSCNGCDKEVVGFRYKCVYCPEYDLCENCEGKQLHKEHYMIRIPAPENKAFDKKMLKDIFKLNRHNMKMCERECKRSNFHHNKHHFAESGQSHSRCGGIQMESHDFGLPMNFEGVIASLLQNFTRFINPEEPDVPTKEKPTTTATSTANNTVETEPNIDGDKQFKAKESQESSCSTYLESQPLILQDSTEALPSVSGISSESISVTNEKSSQNLKELLSAGGDMQPTNFRKNKSSGHPSLFMPVQNSNLSFCQSETDWFDWYSNNSRKFKNTKPSLNESKNILSMCCYDSFFRDVRSEDRRNFKSYDQYGIQ